MRPVNPRWHRLGLIAGLSVALVSWPVLAQSSVTGMHPHGYCYLWDPTLVGLHVTADGLIGLSYLTISLTLAHLVYRGRDQVPFSWMFLAFGAFIIACGATHFVEIWTLWVPAFWWAANVKIVTAVASVMTAVALPPLVPKVLAMVESARLSEKRHADLGVAQRELAALAALRHSEDERARLLVRERQAREEAQNANRMKDEFLAGVSHELRTPLNAILGWSRMLRTGALDPDKAAKAIETVERNATIQAQLIDDLLDVSRIISGKLRLDVRPIELTTVVDAAIDAVRPAASAKDISVTSVRDLSVPVTGDPDRLQQVAWNLLSNAVKFTPQGGRVQVALQCVDAHAELIVSDTGVGISADFLPAVFERFAQGHRSSGRQGLGLGLGIVRHLTELHGGTVSAASPGDGSGATFTVRLPLRTTRPSDAEPLPPPPGGAPSAVIADGTRLAALTVLVVDDDADARQLLRAIVEANGGRVLDADTPATARERFSEPIDLIVSDIGMPGENGYAFLRALRAEEIAANRRRTPAIAVTAFARTQDRLDALAAGFDMHIAKPVEPAELVAVMTALLRHTRGPA